MKRWRTTVYACYLGNFIQAIIVNVTPILFLTLIARYDLSFEQMGRLVLVNFLTQVGTDLLFSRWADRMDLRRLMVGTHLLAAVGLAAFAAAALLPQRWVYTGFTAATFLFSAAGGLLELLLSPIIHAIPASKEKAAAMSLLHSFYSWGQVIVVLLTTLLVFVTPADHWNRILLFWSCFPLLGAWLFSRAPLAPLSHEESRMGPRALLRERYFLLCLAAMVFCGAAETVLPQWASGFLETVLRLDKLTGDLIGVCVFAFAMGVGRILYARYAARMDVLRVMCFGCLAAAVCYLLIAVSPWAWLSLLCCGICGLAVSLLWPGCLVLSASRFAMAGAAMFALLSSAGDSGGSLGAWMVGLLADTAAPLLAPLLPAMPAAELGLRIGFFVATVFPLAMYLCLRRLRRER